METTRRELLVWLGTLTAQSALVTGCGDSKSTNSVGDVRDGFFSPNERRAVGALANAVLPPDDTPGGEALGAVPYIERLLTALDGDTPKLFANGPYSGRTAFADGTRPPNDFATFVPVDRVTLAAWRLTLFGSKGVPGGGPNDAITGPVVGLRDLIRDGVTSAMQASKVPLDTLAPDALRDLWNDLEGAFRDTFIELVTQAAFAAPEYGGNPGLAGWKLVHYEGDSMPLGYSIWDDALGAYRERPDAPNSGPNPGPDPEPMDGASLAFIDKLIALTGGRKFP